MDFAATELPGCYVLRPKVIEDDRGSFTKTFHEIDFRILPVTIPFSEEYVTKSRKGVLRGMHLQLPPRHLDKAILCIQGSVLDVILDVRLGSPTYGRHIIRELCGDRMDMMFVPAGCAHGFYALTDNATLVYKVNRVYAPTSDAGVHWATAGIDWPDSSPIVSKRDQSLPALADFESPFVYDGA